MWRPSERISSFTGAGISYRLGTRLAQWEDLRRNGLIDGVRDANFFCFDIRLEWRFFLGSLGVQGNTVGFGGGGRLEPEKKTSLSWTIPCQFAHLYKRKNGRREAGHCCRKAHADITTRWWTSGARL